MLQDRCCIQGGSVCSTELELYYRLLIVILLQPEQIRVKPELGPV